MMTHNMVAVLIFLYHSVLQILLHKYILNFENQVTVSYLLCLTRRFFVVFLVVAALFGALLLDFDDGFVNLFLSSILALDSATERTEAESSIFNRAPIVNPGILPFVTTRWVTNINR